jgi:membrane-bound ClpP family serine protease
MVPQIPYTAIGIGIAVILGTWAFIVAETVKAKALIAGAAILVFIVGTILRSSAGRLVALIGWMLYGLGCIIFLRFSGIEIR